VEQVASPEDIYVDGIEMAGNGRNFKKKLVKVAASPQW